MSVVVPSELEAAARAWMAEDPDPATRAEVEGLLEAGDAEGLAERFGARLEFGTAGLRGPLGAGPARMNRAVVRRAAAGLVRYLLASVPGAAEAGVVVGYDARHGSADFAADTAAVVAGAGVRALVLPRPLPTPLLAFAVVHLGGAAGVMVTASHNPAADNGYKVYLGDGAQIVPPIDAEISAAIDAVGPLAGVALAPEASPLVERLDDAVVDAFVATVADRSLHLGADARDVVVAYTAMHGVGRDVALSAFTRAGFAPPSVVAAQAEPDADFPTVPFPNPEEAGAMDLVLAEAARVGADLALANDPDADRLGAAVPDPSGGWRVLRGDETGALLADHVLRHTAGADRLVATTVVSSSLLRAMAAAEGVAYAETLTGFKWVARAAAARPGTRFAFGYEEALGFAVSDAVRDKDGIGAALALAEVAALAKRQGRTLAGRLDDLARRFGLHATDQWSVRLEGAKGRARVAEVMTDLREAPPLELAGRAVVAVEDLASGRGGLAPSDVVVLRLDGARVVVRPSGTEPKLKLYFEVVLPVGDSDAAMAAARRRARDELVALRAALAERTGSS